ncbi:son RNA binding protein isoform 2-T2 [Cochliomyia hominivorax]
MAQASSNEVKEPAANNNEDSNADLNAVVKIKQEKIDPEIEEKIKLLKDNIKTEHPDNSDSDTQETNGQSKNKDSQDETDDEDEDSNDSDSSSQENGVAENGEEPGEDEKKNIEPVKSSNEILTELFKVFNAAPPEELLDDKSLIKKAKKHKKDKKKKHKKHKGDEEDTDAEEGEEESGEKHKHKKSKKKHKHKHKDGTKDKEKDKINTKDKEKDKETAKSKDKEKEKSKSDKKSSERDKSRDRDLSKDRAKKRKRQQDKDDYKTDSNNKRKRLEEKDNKSNSFYNGFKDREDSRDRSDRDKVKIKTEPKERKSRRHSEDDRISEISLSDEETYLKEKETRHDYTKRKVHNSFYESSRDKERDRNRGHSKDRYRDRDRDRDRDNNYRNRGFSRRYHSRYSRSRSRSRSHDLGIDKKRLLEIARKNAISMFKRGNLPGCDNMSQEIKDKVLLKMRYGARTVEDLTEFCKKISNGKNLSDLSSDEDSDVDKAGNTKAFHHPFQLKEREPIVMHIRNSKPIVPVAAKTEEQTKAITMQFPVSSGQQHRMTEHWVPVETKDNLTPLPVLPAALQSTTIFKSNLPKNALGKPLPMAEEQEPAFKPVPPPINNDAPVDTPAVLPTVETSVAAPVSAAVPPIPVAPPLMPTNIPPPSIAVSNTVPIVNATSSPTVAPTPAFVPDVPVPSTNNTSIFPQTNCANLDVSSIISKRLNAMRRLQENPMDPEALKMMYNSQKEMSTWASSKHLPGQFTGSTGVNVLKPNELNSGPQVWARRDQLTSTKPVTGGMGMHLLQKMGWKPGEGLGREKNGSLQPLLLDVKLDKRGLVARDDSLRKAMLPKRRGVGGLVVQSPQIVQQNLEEKHPVCLLNELTSKRKWTPPLYTLVHENGPSHSKMFLFSVQVNGQTFTPDKACNTKKEAKMIAARHCLQQIGILPKC